MFYSFELAVAAGNTVNNKKVIEMPLMSGVIHQVDIVFPDSCNHNIRVQIFDASLQLWPFNRNGTIRGDASVISFRDFHELTPASNLLTAVAWWADSETAVTVFVQIGILPRSILQPFSLAELLRAVQRAG